MKNYDFAFELHFIPCLEHETLGWVQSFGFYIICRK